MYSLLRWASVNTVLLIFGLTTGIVTSIIISTPALAQETTPNPGNEGNVDVDIKDKKVEVDLEPRLNYIGVGGNIGIGGDSAIGEGSFVVYSKVELTRNISARPAIAIDDDPTILLPITYDFNFRTVNPGKGEPLKPFPVAPFIGGGLGIEASDDADVGPLITGGVDIPLSSRITLTGTANVLFIDDTDVGLMLGVGYRF